MKLPELPTLRALTRELRELHEAWSHPDAGGEFVALWLDSDVGEPAWRAHAVSWIGFHRGCYGHEYVPGTRACGSCAGTGRHEPEMPCAGKCDACDGTGHVPTPFDAIAAARRLLAAARDGLAKR